MDYKIIRFTKFILDFMFYAGIFTCVTLFGWIRLYSGYNVYFETFLYQLYVLFLLSGILAVLIIRELRKMFQTVLADDCFVQANVTSLQKMGTYSFGIAIITAMRLLLYITPAVLIVILVFVIAGLFSKVLSYVFDRAVSYKLENDLTI
ncbi:MAG: DUF2975 domain-containing protein [Lachnospiraceae bacterium]|nr:DUF2975 domain-containing protein [Lachnospiraceae bacterium]